MIFRSILLCAGLCFLFLSHAEATEKKSPKRKSKAKAATKAKATPSPTPTEKKGDEEAVRVQIQKIIREVSRLRKLDFLNPIGVENQSEEDFERYVDHSLDKQMPGSKFDEYGKVIKKLGLYNGPEIENFRGMAKLLITSQAAAYYDPETKKFYVLFQQLSDFFLGTLYAHELTHGLQDQHFDLNKYMGEAPPEPLNDDELIARQAVVEGEATYIMTLWQLKSMSGSVPSHEELEPVVRQQSEVNMDAMQQMVQSKAFKAEAGSLNKSIEAMKDIPRFMLEMLIGAYMKGMYFVFEIEKEGGWQAVDELYKRPPASFEQILHPEKYRADERPFAITWPEIAEDPVLRDYELLEKNTLGELALSMIFTEFKLGPLTTKKAAEGWDGDSYMVLKHKDSGKLVLLLTTCWDSEKEAKEFQEAYEKVIAAKYPEGESVADIKLDGQSVMIIEADNAETAEKLRPFMKKAQKTKSQTSLPDHTPRAKTGDLPGGKAQ